MNINSPPIDVEITVESESLDRSAFYNVCFITENDVAPRTVEVSNLSDLLSYGYTRDSLAYNFCLTVFAQQSIPSVYVRAKRKGETYSEAFISDTNAGYYFVVIDSKLDEDVKTFNEYLTTADEFKLQFYSSNKLPLEGKKLVHYTSSFAVENMKILAGDSSRRVGNKTGRAGLVPDVTRVITRDSYISKALNLGLLSPKEGETSIENFQLAKTAYPEAAWIAECANSFPSRVQWLHKYLVKPDIVKYSEIPDRSNTTAIVLDTKATVGSGTTMQGVLIHEQVSLDWVKWAISRKVWNLLYNTNKLPSTIGGIELIKNEIKNVLDLAVEEGVFSKYHIKDVSIAKDKETVKASFSATLMHSILGASISGSLYH